MCHRQQRACPVYAMSTLSSAEKRLTPCWTDSARSEISFHRSPRRQPHRNNLASLTSHNTHSQSHTTGTNSFFFARLYIINPFCFLFKNYPCSTRKYVQLFFFSLPVFIIAIPFVSIARRESFLSAQHENLFLYVFVLLKKNWYSKFCEKKKNTISWMCGGLDAFGCELFYSFVRLVQVNHFSFSNE